MIRTRTYLNDVWLWMLFSIRSSIIVNWSGCSTIARQTEKKKQATWRCLCVIYNDDSSVSIHDRNIQCLVTEMYKVSNVLSPPVVSNIFTQKIVTLTVCDLIFSFPDLLLALHFTGSKVYSTLVQLSGTFSLIVGKNYLILVFLKTELKNGNLQFVPADFTKHLFIESTLQAFAPAISIKLWHFSHSCLYKCELDFKFLTFMIIIKSIAF